MYRIILLLFFIINYTFSSTVFASGRPYRFEQLTATRGLSSSYVEDIHQSCDGLMWIATRNGLFQFNGYTFRVYKSNQLHARLLTSNYITCLHEDADGNLWIGTDRGLNVLNRKEESVRRIKNNELDKTCINAIVSIDEHHLMIGTEKGLFQFDTHNDSLVAFNKSNTHGVFSPTTVKSLLHDKKGYIWIGTWERGLYRYHHARHEMIAYPMMNAGNSAHVLYEDSKNNIWVGTWGHGLQRLINAYDAKNVSWYTYNNNILNESSINSNLIYSISEDKISQRIWVGTNLGLSILEDESLGRFTNYYPQTIDNEKSVSSGEISTIYTDKQGFIWLGYLGCGVNFVNPIPSRFNTLSLQSLNLKRRSLKLIHVNRDGHTLWMSTGHRGLMLYDINKQTATRAQDIDAFKGLDNVPNIQSILEAHDGRFWMGSYNKGIYIYDPKKKGNDALVHLNNQTGESIKGGRIYALHEDKEHTMWVGSEMGISAIKPSGKTIYFGHLTADSLSLGDALVLFITTDKDGNVWAATSHNGIYRLQGKGDNANAYTLENFSIYNQKLDCVNLSCIAQDKHGRIWAGGEGGGLNLYDEKNNCFVQCHKTWNLAGDAVYNLQVDEHDNLWMATNVGLMCVMPPADGESAKYRLYSVTDGLTSNIYGRCCSDIDRTGTLYYACAQGISYFNPRELLSAPVIYSPLVITDIKIHNQNWNNLDFKERYKISALAPAYAQKITLNYKQNNFNIEFASLGYDNPTRQYYAYMLEGIDHNWHYVNASQRNAYYNNLPAGTYHFMLKATNGNGVWNPDVKHLEIVILPPPWLTWWAKMIYALLVLAIGYFIYRNLMNRMRVKNELQLREVERDKAMELSHAKLQFFTNITHELLTPLTIISAAIDELLVSNPQNKERYEVITNNINRLIRLIQQILEFRKVESGNLKLRVACGNITQFIQDNVNSFKPLIKKKRLELDFITEGDDCMMWYDADKIDKILYNLLSNAAKYNKPGGHIRVSIAMDEHIHSMILKVKDDGDGIPQKAQATLFKRFYDGQYREHKTIGTGIGLSLTRDLVTLHHGSITVESDLGKGTCFTVTIPTEETYYTAEERGGIAITEKTGNASPGTLLTTPQENMTNENEDTPKYSLLIVEDNAELTELMAKLLANDYRIFTAPNGRKALEVLEEEEVDLIVSDVMMPEMDGMELCKHIKEDINTSHIPVMLLTAKTAEMDQANGYQAGADSYLTKPFNSMVLHARIENLIKARQQDKKTFKNRITFETEGLNYTSIDEDFLQRAINCVQQNLTDADYDLDKFLNDMGTSKSTLFRKMKSLTGMSYVTFIRNVRLKEAARILSEKKNVRISELAYAVGFNDPRYFSACFKKEFGATPKEYYETYMNGFRQRE